MVLGKAKCLNCIANTKSSVFQLKWLLSTLYGNISVACKQVWKLVIHQYFRKLVKSRPCQSVHSLIKPLIKPLTCCPHSKACIYHACVEKQKVGETKLLSSYIHYIFCTSHESSHKKKGRHYCKAGNILNGTALSQELQQHNIGEQLSFITADEIQGEERISIKINKP